VAEYTFINMNQMFAPIPEVTLLDNVESALATWSGRDNWPETVATVDLQLLLPVMQVNRTWTSTQTAFSYLVADVSYTGSFTDTTGNSTPLQVGDQFILRYDPRKPSRYYYPPARQLAGRLIVAGAVLVAVLAI
jgi:hypothetical protein